MAAQPCSSSPPISPVQWEAETDEKLPCDVRVNSVMFRKGVRLQTLVAAAARWHGLAGDLAPRRIEKLREALVAEGHAYEDSLEREDGWIARCEAAERRAAALLATMDPQTLDFAADSFDRLQAAPRIAEALRDMAANQRAEIAKTEGSK